MNKKIIVSIVVSMISFNFCFAMEKWGAPNDPALIQYYLELFEQEKKEMLKKQTPTHEEQMQEYRNRHQKKLKQLEDSGALVVIQENGDGDEVVKLESLLNECSLAPSTEGFVISTHSINQKNELVDNKLLGKKRDAFSRPTAEETDPKKIPLPELLQEVLNLHDGTSEEGDKELGEAPEDRNTIIFVGLGQKRKDLPREQTTAKKSKNS